MPVSQEELKNEDFIDKDLIGKEIAYQDSNIYYADQFIKYNPDDLVSQKGLEIYRKMLVDEQIITSLNIKKFSRLSTPWSIKTKINDDEDATFIAKEIEDNFKQIKGTFEEKIYDIMSSFEYGFSITEKLFDFWEGGEYKGNIRLKDLKTREPFNYKFKTDNYGNLEGIVWQGGITTELNLGTLENPFPTSKFLIYSYNKKFCNHYGNSDLRACFRAWWSKDIMIKFWNIYMERHAMPTTLATVDPKSKIDKNNIAKLDTFLKNIQTKSGLRVPPGVKVELLETQKNGQVAYEAAIDKYDTMISRAIMIPNLLGFNENNNGSYALGKSHLDIFIFILKKIGNEIEELINEEIITPLVKLNYGNDIDKKLIPQFKFESLDEEDTRNRAEIVKLLVEKGVLDPREVWIREYVQLPTRDTDDYPFEVPLGQAVVVKPTSTFPPTGFSKKAETCDCGQNHSKKFQEKTTRQPNKFEKKINFKAIMQETNILEDSLRKDLQTVIVDWKKEILKKGEKILDEQDINAINKLQLRGVGDFKNILRNNLDKVHLDSKLRSFEELGDAGLEISVKRKFSNIFSNDIAFEPWEPLDPKDAIDFFNRKVITKLKDGNKEKLIVLGKQNELTYYDKKAFYIAGVESDNVLKQAKAILLNGIKNGDRKQTMTSLASIFDNYLNEGVIKDGEITNPSRIETIVRTNTMEAYNNGRSALIHDPDITDFVPYVQYSAIMDDRTTDYCAAMDGKNFKKDEITEPPAHFNCRSILVPITSFEANEYGVELTNYASLGLTRPTGFSAIKEIDETENKIRIRLIDPEEFIQDSFRTIELSKEKGIYSVVGKLKSNPNGNTVNQNIMFDTDKWTTEEAKSWVSKHNFKIDKDAIIKQFYVIGIEPIPALEFLPQEVIPEPLPFPENNEAPTELTPKEKATKELEVRYAVRCPFQNCGSSDIKLIKMELGVQTYICNECNEMFRITDRGNLYVWEKGLEKWERKTRTN